MNLSSFDPQLEILKDKYRCISWDERGFGESVAKENFTYCDSANDALSLLNYLKLKGKRKGILFARTAITMKFFQVQSLFWYNR